MNESFFQKLKLIWGEIYSEKQSNTTKINNELEHLTILKFAENNKVFACIVNLIDFVVEYATPNSSDILGVQVEPHSPEFLETLFNGLDPEYRYDLFEMVEQLKSLVLSTQNETAIVSLTYSVCGIKFNAEKKETIRLLNRNIVLEFNEHRQPVKVLWLFQDISHLVKNDYYCIRIEVVGRDSTFYVSKRSDTEGYSKHDLLSEREKEILKWIGQGKEADEIAKILYISKVTVNNHRQNMLNKLGVKDATALIQLARLTKMI